MQRINKLRKAFGSSILIVVMLSMPVSASAQSDDAALAQMNSFLELMHSFFGIIESMHEVSGNPEMSAIFQMHKIQEIYKERGEKARAIGVFKDVLTKSSNQTVRNAAYMMLSDALKDTGQANEAIKALEAGLNENIRQAR